jgi:tRNA/rRNA methyltransferase
MITMPNYRVILVEPAFEESIGFVARAMKNFGLATLRLVNPIAAFGPDGRMRGGHAQDILDSMTIHNSLSEALDDVDLSIGTTAQRAPSSANLLRRPTTPRELGEVLANQAGTVGIVFGREGTGLNNHELSQCDALVTIPADPGYGTLNLSHAAAIVFYELYHPVLDVTGDELATEDVRKTLLKYLSASMAKAVVEEYKIGLTIRAVKNVLGRSAIRRREASLLAGALRQISNALRESHTPDKQVSADEHVSLQLEQ